MQWIDFAIVFAANFAFIGLKAAQQRNVMGAHYALIAITSYFLAATEVYIVWKIANVGPTLPMVLAIGSGAALGATSATALHARFVK